MDTQRNSTRNLIQGFFAFQRLHHYTHLPCHQHIHLAKVPIILCFPEHLFSLFHQKDRHKQHRIRSVLTELHHHHLWSMEMESCLFLLLFSLPLILVVLPFQLYHRLGDQILNLLLSWFLLELDWLLCHCFCLHFKRKLVLDRRKLQIIIFDSIFKHLV